MPSDIEDNLLEERTIELELPSLEYLAQKHNLTEKDAAAKMADTIRNLLKEKIEEGKIEGIKQVLNILKFKEISYIKKVFGIDKSDANYFRRAMSYKDFNLLTNSSITLREVADEMRVHQTTADKYRNVLRETLGPEIVKYKKRKMSEEQLYDFIFDVVKTSEDGMTATEIITVCGEAYTMAKHNSIRSKRKRRIFDMIESLEKDKKIYFHEGNYFSYKK